jgi:putative membrane protein
MKIFSFDKHEVVSMYSYLLDTFGFVAMWSPYFLLFIIGVTVIYFMIIGPWRGRFQDSEPVSKKQITFFVIGMFLLYLSIGGPIDLLGHLMFTFHMVQMAVALLVVPPLLMLGLPKWLLRSIVQKPFIKPVVKFFTKPLISLIIFNGLFSFYHVPFIFDLVKMDVFLHALYTSVLFFASLMMWWPLLNPLPEWESLNGLKKIAYLIADSVLITPACGLIIFADSPLYSTYTDAEAWLTALKLCVPASMLSSLDLPGPQMFNILPILEDQQLGGIIMKIIQELTYGTILAFIFFQWVKSEREKEEWEDKRLAKQLSQPTTK